MDGELTSFVTHLHAAARPAVIAVTGGGSGAIAALLAVPGASRTVLEALVPYSAAALVEYLDARPESFCSARTARAMAMRAWMRAGELAGVGRAVSPSEQTVDGRANSPSYVGVGCTAALATDRPKRGEHRAFVALQDAERTMTVSVTFEKGSRSRGEEEELLTRVILAELGRGVGLAELPMALGAGDSILREEVVAEPECRELLLGQRHSVPPRFVSRSETSTKTPAFFPGAFNPLHEGHREMARVAAEMLGRPVAFEISVENVDKPPLDYAEIAARVRQFAPGEPLWLTRAATFVEKARLFPGATFLVGADTIVRIAEPKYYASPAACQTALTELAASRCHFLVFGRVREGRFESLADLPLPPELRAICQEVPESRFRLDLSSTELRQDMD